MSTRLPFPGVPAPKQGDIDSMFRTVNALYQAYNTMSGVPEQSDLTVWAQGNFDPDVFVEVDGNGTADIGLGDLNDTNMTTKKSGDGIISVDGIWYPTNTFAHRGLVFRASCPAGLDVDVDYVIEFNAEGTTMTWQAEGVYEVVLSQSTILTYDILDFLVTSINWNASTFTSVNKQLLMDGASVDKVTDPTHHRFNIVVYEIDIAGQNVLTTPVNLEQDEGIAFIGIFAGAGSDLTTSANPARFPGV